MTRTTDRPASGIPGAPSAGMTAYGELLAVTVIWGIGPVAIKVASGGFAPLTASSLRLALASCLYLPLLAMAHRRGVTLPRGRDLPWFALLALFGFVLFNLFYFTGMQYTTATHGALIWGANPVATGLLAALLLGERAGPRTWVGVLVSTSGVMLVVLSSTRATTAHGASLLGDILLVGEMLSWVGYTLVSRVVMRRYTPLQTTGYACLLAAVLLLPIAALSGARPAETLDASGRAWVAILFSGTVSVVLAYILWNRSVLRLGATSTAVFSNLTTPWSLLFAYLIEAERIALLHYLAMSLIIGGVLLTVMRPRALVAPRPPQYAGGTGGEP